VKVSWDDEIPNIWKNKIHAPNHQPDDMWDLHHGGMEYHGGIYLGKLQ